jgi:predicted dehydrogenase
MSAIRIAVVGCGYWGPNLIRSFAQVRDGRLVALCDRDAGRLEAVGRDYPSVARVPEYDFLLADPAIDAIAIAAPAASHYRLAKKALLSGKHVYVEKPMCLSTADAADLVATAARQERILMVGHLLEYHPAVEFLKSWIDGGCLGDLRYLYSQRLNLGQVRHDENVLWSLAPHDIAVAHFLFGEQPDEVHAVGRGYLRSGIPDVVFLTLTYPDGKMAHIHVSWLDPHKTRRLTVVGSLQMAVFDDMEPAEKLRLYDKGVDLPPPDNGVPGSRCAPVPGAQCQVPGSDKGGPALIPPGTGHLAPGTASAASPRAPSPAILKLRFGDIRIPSLPTGEPLRAECQHFVNCLRDGRTPRSDGRDGLRVVQVLEAAERSLRNGGRPVAIQEHAEVP